MAGSSFQLSVVTPERQVLSAEVKFVAFPAFDGEMGVLPGRSALLTQLGSGLLRWREVAGGERRIFVSGGFAQMVEDQLTLLTEETRETEALTSDLAARGRADADSLAGHSEEEFETKRRALERARALHRLTVR